jgi:ribonuclease P protein component
MHDVPKVENASPFKQYASDVLLKQPDCTQYTACFPKSARLLKAEAFSSVLRTGPVESSRYFVLFAHYTGKPARLGLIVGRKYAPRAVSRNLIRRIAREVFRMRHPQLAGWDILIRLHRRLDRQEFTSAASMTLKRACRCEIEMLVAHAVCHRF